jgi:hypothetical protein
MKKLVVLWAGGATPPGDGDAEAVEAAAGRDEIKPGIAKATIKRTAAPGTGRRSIGSSFGRWPVGQQAPFWGRMPGEEPGKPPVIDGGRTTPGNPLSEGMGGLTDVP